MVTEYGMSTKLGRGPATAPSTATPSGPHHGRPGDYSHEVRKSSTDEVAQAIEAAHTEAWEILTSTADVLDILAGELLRRKPCTAPSWRRSSRT